VVSGSVTGAAVVMHTALCQWIYWCWCCYWQPSLLPYHVRCCILRVKSVRQQPIVSCSRVVLYVTVYAVRISYSWSVVVVVVVVVVVCCCCCCYYYFLFSCCYDIISWLVSICVQEHTQFVAKLRLYLTMHQTNGLSYYRANGLDKKR